MFLFKVKETFQLQHGLVLVAESVNDKMKIFIGDKLKIVRPDNTIIETVIKGMAMHLDVLVDAKQEDVPVSSEVWSVKKDRYLNFLLN